MVFCLSVIAAALVAILCLLACLTAVIAVHGLCKLPVPPSRKHDARGA